MITTGKYSQIYHPDRGFLLIDHRSRGFAAGQPPPPIDEVYQWVQPAGAGGYWYNEGVDRFLGMDNCPIDTEGLIVLPAPHCHCCGEVYWPREMRCVVGHQDPAKREYRCHKHHDRNPCAIEGCERTRVAKSGFGNNRILCSEHWRRYVPARSPLRRTYHRFWRLAKRDGWTPELLTRFNRFWDGLIARVRRQSTEGRLDMTEINKMFGWEDAA